MTNLTPLSDFAIGVLREIKRRPLPRHEVNPGVLERLQAENLIECKKIEPLPYKNKRATVQFLSITKAGEERLAADGR